VANWWRCPKCVHRVQIAESGYKCHACKHPCDSERVRRIEAVRAKPASVPAVASDSTGMEDDQYGIATAVSYTANRSTCGCGAGIWNLGNGGTLDACPTCQQPVEQYYKADEDRAFDISEAPSSINGNFDVVKTLGLLSYGSSCELSSGDSYYSAPKVHKDAPNHIQRELDHGQPKREFRTLQQIHDEVDEEMECIICTNIVSRDLFPQRKITDACQHEPKICLICLGRSIENDLQNRDWNQIRCPSCLEILNYRDIKSFATQDTFKR
jgi:hypothetical protein